MDCVGGRVRSSARGREKLVDFSIFRKKFCPRKAGTNAEGFFPAKKNEVVGYFFSCSWRLTLYVSNSTGAALEAQPARVAVSGTKSVVSIARLHPMA